MPVRIKINPNTIWGSFHHPVEKRLIVAGDEFNVDRISDSGMACYKGSDGMAIHIDADNYTVIEEVVEAAPTTHPCTCDIVTLMAKGCQCGAIQRERDAPAIPF
jgi:hypothetical protein